MDAVGRLVIFCALLISANTLAAASPLAKGKWLLEKVNNGKTGEKIIVPAGHYRITKPITLFTEGVSLIGAGKKETVLDFSEVNEAGQAILIRGPSITVQGLTILNSPGDGLAARGVQTVSIRDVKVVWEKRSASGYGIYPVQCKGVVIEKSQVVGALEAGIYVGQTNNASVSNNTVHENVVGIDIENSTAVTVTNNYTHNNSVGIAITGRPYLTVKNPRYIRISDNVIETNNKPNFGPDTAFTSKLGFDYGIVVVAVRDVSIEGNQFLNDLSNRADVLVANFNWLNESYDRDALFERKFSGIRIGINDVTPIPNQQNSNSKAKVEKKPMLIFVKGIGGEPMTTDHICLDRLFSAVLQGDGGLLDSQSFICKAE